MPSPRKKREPALVKELEQIGKGMTRTAEVDFYGTYKIDFSAVQSIKSPSFALELPNFITELQKGNVENVQSAQKGIPKLFKSYRFLDYLLSKLHVDKYPSNVLEELNRIKATCPKPAYLTAECAQAAVLTDQLPPAALTPGEVPASQSTQATEKTMSFY